MSEVPELAPTVLRLLDAGAFPSTVEAVRSGRLGQRSGPATIGAVASGRPGVTTTLQGLQRLWSARYSATDGAGFADILEAVAEGAMVERTSHPATEVVWTGPKVEGSYLRATRQVVQDIIKDASQELLVVGYWIAGKGDQEGIIRDVIGLIAEAAARGIDVTMVLDSGDKTYGKNNRDVLAELWPVEQALPELLTWEVPESEKHLKLHAKVLVADRHDALVTSANLTMHALDRNMEMGVRVTGTAGARIAHHFDLLRRKGELVPFVA